MLVTCLKVTLGITNFIFLIVGLAMTAAGTILAYFPGKLLGSYYDDAVDELNSLAAPDQFQVFDSSGDMKDLPFIYEVGILLMVLGIFLTVVSFTGCFGSCCCSCCRYLLIVFSVLMILLLLAEIVAFALFFTTDSTLHSEIRSELKSKIRDPWDETNRDTFTLAMNIINYNFDCCGIDGVGDFSTTPKSCTTFTRGCYSELTDNIDDNIVFIGLGAAAFLVIQLIEVIFAIVIFKDGQNKILPV